MKRISVFFLSAVFAIVSSAKAETTITAVGVDTPGLAGYKTWTVSANSTDGLVNGIDVTFDGAINQVELTGLSTIFNDFNALIPTLAPGKTADQDSQFMFKSSDILHLQTQESTSLLKGALTNLRTKNTGGESGPWSLPFAQLVIPNAASGTVNFNAQLDIRKADGSGSLPVVALNGVIGDQGTTNQPPSVTSAILDITLPQGVDHTFAATDDGVPTPGLTWALDSFTGPGGGNAPTLNAATGQFQWTPGSAKGGQYIASVTATDAGGLSGSGTLTINVTVPEPSTIALLGLSVVGLVGLARRRG